MATSVRSTATVAHSFGHGTTRRGLSPLVALVLWVGLCVLGGALIGAATNGGADPWYMALRKPAWNPPSWVFAPVWTTLYVLMGVAAWRVWRHGGWTAQRAALSLFLAQLAVNFAWSPLFFTAHMPTLALADLVVLWLLVVATMRAFRAIDATAAWLLVPYLAWVSYASTLNAALVAMN